MLQYRRFLRVLHDEMVNAIMEGENMGWHHLGGETPEYKHFLRLLTWEREVTGRMAHYDDAKVRSAWKRVRRATPRQYGTEGNILGGPNPGLELDGIGGQLYGPPAGDPG